jgi:hypothetical protein
MKKTNFVVSFAVSVFFAAVTCLAAPKSAPAASSFSPTPTNFSTTSKRVGLGFTTAGPLTSGGNIPGFSGWFELSGADSLQAVFGIGSTDPFQFGLGGYFRHRVAGNENAGFHLGGGLLLGTVGNTVTVAGVTGSNTDFYIAISPLAGFQFNVPTLSNIFMSVDGGLNFVIVDGNFNLSATSLSPALGLSIHYLL